MTLAMIVESNPPQQVTAASDLIAQFFWSCLQAGSNHHHRRHHHHHGGGAGTSKNVLHSFSLGEALLKNQHGKLAMGKLMPRLVQFILKSVDSTELDRQNFYNRGNLKGDEIEDPHLNIWGSDPNTLRKKCASLLDLAAGKLVFVR